MLTKRQMTLGDMRIFSTTAGLEVVRVEEFLNVKEAVVVTKIPWAEIGIKQVKFRDGGAGCPAQVTIDGINLQAMSHAELLRFGNAVEEGVKREMQRRGSA